MANYTQSVREILQFNKRQDENLVNIADVYAIANRTLFADTAINVIDNDYREKFITGFALHFMNEELGYETLPLWKIALNEKLFNSGTYINKIFANLDKEIFANYSVKNTVNAGTKSGSKASTATLSSERDIAESATDTSVKDATDVLTKNLTLTKAGSEMMSKDGQDTLKKEGAEVKSKAGKDTLTKKGSEYTVDSGSDATTDETFEDRLHSNSTTTDTNGVAVAHDTPMGALSNLRTPGGDVDDVTSTTISPIVSGGDFDNLRNPDVYSRGSNSGYDYEEGQTYNYMSSAHEEGSTQQGTDNGNEQSYTKNVNTLSHGKGTLLQYGKDAQGVADSREDETAYGMKEDTVYGKDVNGNAVERKDTTQYGSQEIMSYGVKPDGQGGTLEDARIDTEGGTESRDIDDTTTKTLSASTDDDLSQTTEVSETTSDEHEDTLEQTDYSLNWEMLYRSMPLLNKVWEIFDDLFMLIF